MSEFTERTAPGLIGMFKETIPEYEKKAVTYLSQSLLGAAGFFFSGSLLGYTVFLQHLNETRPQQAVPSFLLSTGYVVAGFGIAVCSQLCVQKYRARRDALQQVKSFENSISILEQKIADENSVNS